MLSLLVSHTKYRNSHKYLIDLITIHMIQYSSGYDARFPRKRSWFESQLGNNIFCCCCFLFAFVVFILIFFPFLSLCYEMDKTSIFMFEILEPGGQLWANTAFEGSQFYSIGVPKFYSWVNVISVYEYNDLG